MAHQEWGIATTTSNCRKDRARACSTDALLPPVDARRARASSFGADGGSSSSPAPPPSAAAAAASDLRKKSNRDDDAVSHARSPSWNHPRRILERPWERGRE